MTNCAVIGLGKFGYYVAKGLLDQGVELIAIDKNKENIKELSEYIESAYCLDSTDKKALKEAGIVGLDTVVVSIGANIEASILTVMALKDLENKNIIAKAISPTHGEILAKIGAFKIIYPERESAKRLVRDISVNIRYDVIDLSNTFKIAKFIPTKTLIGKSLSAIDKNEDYDVKVFAYKSGGLWYKDIDQSHTIKEDDIISVIGHAKEIEKFGLEI